MTVKSEVAHMGRVHTINLVVLGLGCIWSPRNPVSVLLRYHLAALLSVTWS